MRNLLLVAAMLPIAAGAFAAAPPPTAGDRRLLTGTWRGAEGVWAGRALTAEQARGCVLVIHPERAPLDLGGWPRGMDLRVPDRVVGFEVASGGGKVEVRYATGWEGYAVGLVASARPRGITATKQAGYKQSGFSGVYRLKGDVLTVCFDLEGLGRAPKVFRSARGSRVLLLTLRRAK